jgi:hypothetical protein
MSKNLTRKGLAFGALVALGSTVIAGVPAQAAGEINFAPSAGTLYNTVASEAFVLEASYAPGYSPAAPAQLKYVVTSDGSAVSGAAATTAAAAISGLANLTLDSTTKSAVVASGRSANTDRAFLAVKPGAATDNETVTVTAFSDANNDGALTAGEWNTARTVNFKKLADVTTTINLTQPATADTTVKATLVINDINESQIQSTVGMTLGGVAATLTSGVWSSTVSALAAGASVSAQATLGGTNMGAAVSKTATARTISSVTANVLKGDNAIATAATVGAASTNARVRTNGAFVASVKALDTATTPVAAANVPVTATVSVSGATLAAAATGVSEVSITVAGTKYTSLTGVTFPVTTAADGTATLAISTVGFTASGSVTVSFAAQNFTSAVVADFEDATYTVADSDKSGSLNRSIAEGGTATINYTVADQFGVAIANGYSLLVTNDMTTDVVTRVNVVNGAATATLTDTTAETATSFTITAALQQQNTSTLNWSAQGASNLVHNVYVRSTAAAFSTAPVSATVARSASNNFTGAVNNAGELVSVSATGVTFTYNSVEYTDKVSFYTGAAGATWTLAAKSNVSGAKTVTFAVGSATATAVLTVSAPTGAQGTKVSFTTAPTTIEPGKTISVVGKLVDEYGNAVSTATPAGSTFSVTYAGPGFVIGSLPTATDANGEFKVQVLTGANDSGNAVFTVTYDADGTGTASAAITATSTVAVAAPAAPEVKTTIVGATKSVRVRVENAKGEEVEIKFGSKTVRVAIAGTNSKLWVINTTKGKKSVKVYVDGDLVAVKTVTVK